MADEKPGTGLLQTVIDAFKDFLDPEQEEGVLSLEDRRRHHEPSRPLAYSNEMEIPKDMRNHLKRMKEHMPRMKEIVDRHREILEQRQQDVRMLQRVYNPLHQAIVQLLQTRESFLQRKGNLESAIASLQEISRVAKLNSLQEEQVKEYFSDTRKLETKKIILKVAHDICLAKAKKKIEQELADLLHYKSNSNACNDGDETEQAVLVKAIEEKGRAYGLLLSATKMKGCSIPEKLTRNPLPMELCKGVTKTDRLRVLQPFANKALDLSWKMVTLLPPAIVCTPDIPFDDDWHDPNRVMYDPEDTTTPLIYYQPVLLFGAAIQVGVKGKIANRRSREEARRGRPGMNVGDDDDQPSSLTSEQKREADPVDDPPTNKKSAVDIPDLEDEPKRLHMPSHVRRADPQSLLPKVCDVCSEPIKESEQSVEIKGKFYHQDHTMCHQCGDKLGLIEAVTLVHDNDIVQCKECIEKRKLQERQRQRDERKGFDSTRHIVGDCIICQKPVVKGGETNIRLNDGNYCHDKCWKTKKCYVCKDHITAADIKNAHLVPNGMWLCNGCKSCKGCMEYFTRNDLLASNSLKKQGNHCWHTDCFKCIKCKELLIGNNFDERSGAYYCPSCYD